MEFFITKRTQKVFQLLAVGLLCVVLLVTGLGCASDKKGINNYQIFLSKVRYSERFMPALHDVGTYESVETYYRHVEMFFFQADSINLTLTYAQKEYEMQKTLIEAAYTFTDVIVQRVHEHGIYCEQGCDEEIETIYQDKIFHSGFVLQLVESSTAKPEYKSSLPKYFGMIGFDDATFRICYLCFYDFDLDVINDMAVFVKDYFVFA